MIEQIRKIASDWLTTKKVDSLLGLKVENGRISPFLFTKPEEINNLVVSSTVKIIKISRIKKRNILYLLQEKYPDAKIGVVVAGCDERALIELSKLNQVNLKKIEILGYACNKDDVTYCSCSRPYPHNLLIGEKVEGISYKEKNDEILNKELSERLKFWKYQFSKCIKCYGCRDACPICTCQDCKMERELYVKTGQVPPPDMPMYHFIRFYHLSDKCIGCGECEKACPMDIPLCSIFKMSEVYLKELFDYETGIDDQQKSPLVTTLQEVPMKGGSI